MWLIKVVEQTSALGLGETEKVQTSTLLQIKDKKKQVKELSCILMTILGGDL